MTAFEDRFSAQAGAYARYRPQYPAALYEWIASIAPGYDRVWDCGTGSGQAAIGLIAHFDQVMATDPSARQIANAPRHPRIEYRVARAEESGLTDRSMDAVTVAQAIHWFDLDKFYAEVRRVLKPGGVLVVWGYVTPRIAPEIDRVVEAFNDRTLAADWSPSLRSLHDRYRTLPFPFAEITAPELAAEAHWTLADLIGHLSSWSGVQAYRQARGSDPIDLIRAELDRAWGGAGRRFIRWPLSMRAGYLT